MRRVREVLRLRHALGMSDRSIAQSLGTNPDSSFRTRMSASARCGHDAALALGSNVPGRYASGEGHGLRQL